MSTSTNRQLQSLQSLDLLKKKSLKNRPLFHRPIDVSQSFYAPNSDWTFAAYRSGHLCLLDKSCQLDGERQRGIIINHAQHRFLERVPWLFHGPGIGVAMAGSKGGPAQVGNSAGRGGDNSSVDAEFARRIGLDFHTEDVDLVSFCEMQYSIEWM